MKKMLKRVLGAIGVIFAGMTIVGMVKKSGSTYENKPEEKNPMEGKKVRFVEDENEKENADGAKGHLEAIGIADHQASFYEKYIKRCLDIVLSFGGLLVLSPVFLVLSLAIFIDDPGPILFTQKRIGQNKKYFKLHKFRSMKMSTPHDKPTHMLENPEQYITRVGKFIRAHSLDELPQIWDIFIGNMSVIGPRPALWNQDLLTAERDKYGANDIKPGLTGWAQINGRDELEIPVKAKFDGEYVQKLGFMMDVKCFLGSVHVFTKDDSVVEGGTGEMNKTSVGRHYTDGKQDAELIGHIGFDKKVVVDHDKKVKVLITGAGSYIGETFKSYAENKYSDNFIIDEVDMLDGTWREWDFSKYDIVYHVAGIAHADVGNVSDETKEKYYKVNTDLAIEVAEKCKAEGVKEFIFMSSMIVYGDSAPFGKEKVIDKNTVPAPANFYGDSKLQADVGVRELADENFKVICLRPPMIYGKGSKGNYPTLAKLAKKLPVFPNVDNQRSMLHIDNLCEFLCQLMLVREFAQESLVLVPQNGEYTRTAEMVKEIGDVVGSKTIVTGILNPAVKLAGLVPGKVSGLVNKAFGNSIYDLAMSDYEGLDYRVRTLKQSIEATEGAPQTQKKTENKKVLFLVNHDVVIYNFRLEIVERLLNDGYEVHISSPYGERIDDLVDLGAVWHDIEMDRHGMNPIHEIEILRTYQKLFREVKPLIVLGFTIKPNIYGAIAAKWANIPFVANITGLGTAVEEPGVKQKVFICLYKYAFSRIQRVFFQNTENQQLFIYNNIAVAKHKLIPGSGVNVERFPVKPYPEAGDGKTGEPVKFLFISRIMKEKGIDQYLEAAKAIKDEYPATEFHICGFCEAEYEGRLDEYNANGTVIYHGMIRNVSEFLEGINCVVHPTYYPEGISNVLLEASSSGRPIITTDRAGCREAIDDGINGYMIPEKNSAELIKAIKKFIAKSNDERMQMGMAGRRKVENDFNRQIVVDAYVDEVETAL